MAFHVTACPRNCYSTCSMLVEVVEGRIRRIEPHHGVPATATGPCLKGLSYVERIASPERLMHPLARTASGGFERISWDQALDRICRELERLRGEPRSVMVYEGSGTKGLLNSVTGDFWRLFGGYTTTYGDLCWPAGLEATRLTLGDNRHSAPEDIAHARLIVLWGKNPAETNIHQMHWVAEAMERGATLVVIDPRRTVSAENADLLVQPTPGTDGTLALGIANRLVARDLVNHPFVAAHVAGFSEFSQMLAEYPTERVAAITGVPAAIVDELAGLFGTLEPVTLCAGYGMQRYSNSGQTMRALLALLALTGNLGRPGAGWVYANLQSHVFSSPRDPVALYPPEANDGPVRVAVATARLGQDMLALTDPPLRMMWVERGNPACQNPDTARVLEAMRRLDFRVVVDQFLTDTAREADLVLPAKTMFEQTDVITAYWHHHVQLKPKLVEPPGEVKPETEIYRLLAGRLGLDPVAVAECIPGPDEASVLAFLRRRLEPFPGLDLDSLARSPQPAPGAEEVAWSELRFPTPSGRIELVSAEAGERWGADPLPRWTPPVEGLAQGSGDRRHPLQLLTPNSKDRIHSQFNNLALIRQLTPDTAVHLSPVDASARGIVTGDHVRVFNDRGSLELEARIDHSLAPGCAWVCNGWWRAHGGGVNQLSAGRETDMGHGAAFHDNLVQVERIG